MNFNLWVKVNKIALFPAFAEIAVDLTCAQVSVWEVNRVLSREWQTGCFW